MQSRIIPVIARAFLCIVITLCISLAVSTDSYGQCSGCNLTITSNTSYTIPAGQTYCLNKNNYTGTITFGAGSTLCIYSGITWTNATLNLSGSSGTINNYGTSSYSFTLPNGYTFNNESGATYSGTLTQSTGSTGTNSGTFSGTLTQNGGTFTNNSSGTMSGGSTIGGTMANNGTMSGTNTISATGSMTTGSNLSGTLIVNGTFTVNSGASPSITSVTVNSGGTINNNGTIQGGSLTANAGSTLNNNSGATISDAISESGTLNNYGTVSGALTGNTGSTITNYSGGRFTGSTTTSGTLNNNSGGTINSLTENTGGTVSNAGSITAGVVVNGGIYTETSTGTISGGGTYNLTVNGGTVTMNSSITNVEVTGGTLNNNASITGQINVTGGTVNNAGTIPGAYYQTGGTVDNSGTINPSSLHLTAGHDSITNLSGGTLTLPGGTNTLPNGLVVTNYGTLTSTSPLVVSAGSTLNLEGTQNMGSTQLTDNGTVNLAGSLTVSTYTGSGGFNEISGGCSTLTTGSNSGTGTFNGGQSTYGGGLIVNTYTGGSSYSNGASATVTAPTQQASALTVTLSGLVVSGSFTSPSAGIAGYIVLRYIGTSPPSCTPVSGTVYTVGSTVGACTVAALVTGGSTGTKTFTDNIPGGDCGQNVYYEVYSYNGAGACASYDVTSPLTGSVAIPAVSAITPYLNVNGTGWVTSATATLCQGQTLEFGPQPLTGTWTYTGPSGFHSYQRDTLITNIQPAQAGTYTATYVDGSGCTNTQNYIITVNTVPSAVTVATPGTYCGSTVLTASGGTGGTMYWEATTNGGTSTATPSSSQTVTSSGTYYFSANNTCGWTQGSAAVTINARPTVAAITGSSAVCIGSTISLTDGTLGGSWTASNGSATILAVANLVTVTGVSAGLDTISYTTLPALFTGCTNTATFVVTVNPLPAASINPTGPSTYCGQGILTASGGGTYAWSNAKTSAADTVTASNLYTVTVTTPATGCTASASNNVTVNAIPAAPTAVTATAATICSGQSSNLKATSAGNTINWWTAATGGTLLGNSASGSNFNTGALTATTTYYAEAYTGAGCASTTRVAVTVTVNPVPAAVTVSGGTTQCGGTVTLTASGGTGGTIYWENTTSNGTSTTTPSTSQSVSASGTYYFNALEGSCWGAQGSAIVTINPVPAAPTAVTATPSAICVGQSSSLSATSGGNTIKWWTAATGGTELGSSASGAGFAISPASTTTYYAADSTSLGCVSASRVAVTVTVHTLPVVGAITGTTTVCAGATTPLSDTTAGGTWTSATPGVATVNASTGLVTGVSAGTSLISYTVTNAFGCVTVVTATVTVNAIPALTSSKLTSCSSASVILRTISGATAYHWTTGATVDSIITATAGTYTVTVTNAVGCTASVNDTIISSTPVITVNNPAKCAGGTDTLIATGGGTGATYLWSTGSLRDSIYTTTAGVYKVTVTNSYGCSATASGIATINPLPTPATENISLCPGSLGLLTTSGGVLYAWSNGSTSATSPVASAGVYTVTATSSGSCTAVASDTVTAAIAPNPSVTSAPICSGSPATLTASGGYSYIWSTGSIDSSISTTTAGTYTVTATSTAGCTATASGTATAVSNPTPTVNSPSICSGNSATLNATGGVSYVWSTAQSGASITVSPTATTTYTVTATNAGHCSATANGTVTVNPRPVAAATNGVICSGSPATLTASGGGTYQWSSGSAGATINPILPGTYTVTVTSSAACTATASGTATVALAPTAIASSATICSGTRGTITATGGGTYLWSTGDTTSAISVSPVVNTTYTVTVTNTAGCTATASGTATVHTSPTVTASSNSPVLLNAGIHLTSTVSGGTAPYTYSWSGPSSFTSTSANPVDSPAQPVNSGVYTVVATDVNGCTATASTSVILSFESPGGIPSNDALWLNGDSGVTTSGSNVTLWRDMSGSGNNATIVNGTSPTLLSASLNSHAVINFAGAGGLQGKFGPAITSSAISAFVVTQPTSTTGNPSGIFSIAALGGTDTSTSYANSVAVFETGTNEVLTQRNKTILGNYTNAAALGKYNMFSSIFSSTANKDSFYCEGLSATNASYTAAALNDTLYTVGSRYIAGPAKYLNGQIAEVILFNKQLTDAQRNQVESYLATKYGFTLNQTNATNYVASNGTTFWNAASNGIYKNNIFGVGYDNISTLNQTKSVSINTAQLSINSATNLGYYSFLMVSDNGVPDTLDHSSNLPNSINAALTTVWRASQTGSRGSANFVLNASTINFNYYAPIASQMTPYMLIDSNADGIYETYVAASSTSWPNITFNYSLNNGARFTFGFKASIDYGDAWSVPTLTANNGAGHMIVPGVYLGSLIDAELDGQPSVNALGDDTIGLADEDGVNFNIGVPTTDNIVTMGVNTIIVTASVAGYLNAWADLNQDGTYGGGSEYEIQNLHLVAGANTVTFTVSDSVLYGPTSMRFRFAQNLGDVTAPTGLATNGEVEDYKIYVTAPLVASCTNGFQNPSFELGPDIGAGTYIITSQSNLPYWRTTAADGMIEQWGNNFNGGGVNVPAYNGTYFVELEANLYGALYQDVYTTPGTELSWSFAHRGRFGNDTCLLKIGTPENPISQGQFIDGEYAWGLHSGFYTVPAGQFITRLAFDAVGSFGGNQSEGNFLDDVSVQSSFDYGDAPDTYGTLFASNGPYHNITSNLYLGYGVTCDADGKPSAGANRDSLDDGITFPTPCNSCGTYSVYIKAWNNSGSPATIAGWIDFNKNGVFDANERASITIPSSTSEQTDTMTFSVTSFSSVSTSTYGRFRIANDSTQIATPYGAANSGEVEDYLVPCIALPVPTPVASVNPACIGGPLTLTTTDTAWKFEWVGPNGYVSNVQNTSISSVPAVDSGIFTVYAIYANGCARDSSIYIHVQQCYTTVNGAIFDDANGNGLIDGTDATTDLGHTVYAVLADNTNTVLATSLVSPTGTFSFSSIPAYESGMTVMAKTSNPAVGATSGGPSWPSNWVGTKGQYGMSNSAGSGVYNTPSIVPVTTTTSIVNNLLIGFDQLPTTTTQLYTIPYPTMNAQKALIPANGLGILAGSDPEDGTYTAGSTFTITSLAGMQGNTLYYDANGDGILQSYEQITGYTTITNFDPSKLYVKFVGAGSTHATFDYGSTDAAGKTDPAPASYTIQWIGTLPVKMLYFNAEKSGETQSLLTWATASEQDNAYFDVERSPDAQTWEQIGQVQGAGTTSVQTNYSLVDNEPLSGPNYYRLKQVDVDGNSTYSEIAEVTFTGSPLSNTSLSVYPNPLSQASKLNIQLTSSTENISEISIENTMGQVVYSTLLPQIQDYQILGLDLPAGVYIVSVRTQTNSVLSSRLVIQK